MWRTWYFPSPSTGLWVKGRICAGSRCFISFPHRNVLMRRAVCVLLRLVGKCRGKFTAAIRTLGNTAKWLFLHGKARLCWTIKFFIVDVKAHTGTLPWGFCLQTWAVLPSGTWCKCKTGLFSSTFAYMMVHTCRNMWYLSQPPNSIRLYCTSVNLP